MAKFSRKLVPMPSKSILAESKQSQQPNPTQQYIYIYIIKKLLHPFKKIKWTKTSYYHTTEQYLLQTAKFSQVNIKT